MPLKNTPPLYSPKRLVPTKSADELRALDVGIYEIYRGKKVEVVSSKTRLEKRMDPKVTAELRRKYQGL